MKKLLTLMLVVGICSSSWSQYSPVIRDSVTYDVAVGSIHEPWYYADADRFVFEGDTTIGAYTYRKLYAHPLFPKNGGLFRPPFLAREWRVLSPYFMREDPLAGKVYIYDQASGNDELLYDFTLAVGDTMQSSYATDGQPLVVTAIDTAYLHTGEPRKRLYLDNGTNYVESVGGSTGLFYPLLPIPNGSTWTMCIKQDTVGLYGTECRAVKLGVQDWVTVDVSVYPNPTASDWVNVDCGLAAYTIRILSMDGRLLIENDGSHDTRVELTTLTAGTYMLEVRDRTEKSVFRVLPIQKL